MMSGVAAYILSQKAFEQPLCLAQKHYAPRFIPAVHALGTYCGARHVWQASRRAHAPNLELASLT